MPSSKFSTASRYSRVFYTYNNPTESYGEWIEKLKTIAKWGIFQLEQGDKETPHYQGVIYLKKQQRGAFLKKFNKKVHWEGLISEDGGHKYCMKDDRIAGPWEFGTKPNPGQRTDYDALYKLAKSGVSPADAAEKMPSTWMKAHRAYDRVQSFNAPKVKDIEIFVLFGDSGAGKSWNAWNIAQQSGGTTWTFPLKFNKDLWFDGYNGQDNVVVEEFSGQMYLETFKQLCDKRLQIQPPSYTPIKGGYCWFNPKRIFFTSNKHPNDWYDWDKHGLENRTAFLRRFDWVAEFKRGTIPKWVTGPDYFRLDLPTSDDWVVLPIPGRSVVVAYDSDLDPNPSDDEL